MRLYYLLRMVASLLLLLAAPTAGALPLAQSASVQQEVFEPTVSAETQAIVDQRDDLPASEIISQLTVLAENDDDSAAELLGEVHQLGLFGVAANPITACHWFEKVATERADSAHNLATCYFEGAGRGQNHAMARGLYLKAANAGWVTSYCALGNMLVRGQGGSVDVVAGMELCQRAAEVGDADAQTDLAIHFLEGGAVEKDSAKAREWLELAAGQGQANALYILAQVYWFGDGVTRDRVEAERLWRESYQAGRADAAYDIMRAILQRSVTETDGQQTLSEDAVPEILDWANRAALEDSNEERREQARGFAASLRNSVPESQAPAGDQSR